jgi:hypothetical protein
MKKIFACSQLFIQPACKKSGSNIFYFRLHKNDKRLNLGTYISNLQISSDFIILCSPQYKECCNKLFILVDYIIEYVLIYFHNFLKLKTMIFNFL